MVDHELIRKAAEAMWKAFQSSLDIQDSRQIPFSNIGAEEQRDYLRNSETALKVFYEHTRKQAREQRPPECPDCGEMMNPGETHITGFSFQGLNGAWFCQSCGRSQ